MKRLGYRLFATAGKIITRARVKRLLTAGKAPETGTITTLLTAIAWLKNTLRQRIRLRAAASGGRAVSTADDVRSRLRLGRDFRVLPGPRRRVRCAPSSH